MDLDEIVTFWKKQVKTSRGHWLHPEDEKILCGGAHSFNLDYPARSFLGNVIDAPVIILGANPGYSEKRTTDEFSQPGYTGRDLVLKTNPRRDWRGMGGEYYEKTNYGNLIFNGKAVMVDVCAYRSSKISEEHKNQKILRELPSVDFTRRWLLQAVLPLAKAQRRLVIAKRWRFWKMTGELKELEGVGVMFDIPQSKHLRNDTKAYIERWLRNNGFGGMAQ